MHSRLKLPNLVNLGLFSRNLTILEVHRLCPVEKWTSDWLGSSFLIQSRAGRVSLRLCVAQAACKNESQ